MLTDLDEALDREVNRARRLEDFQAAADLLLAQQFAYSRDRGSSKIVSTILANRGYFEDLMLAVGRRLVVDDRVGMTGALPLDGRGRRLPVDDTLLLLTMRLVYQEGIPAKLTEAGEVEATTDEIVAKLEELSHRRRADMPRLKDWTRLHETLDTLGPGLVRLGDAVEGEDRNRAIHLRAGLLHAVGADALERLEAFADELEARRRIQPESPAAGSSLEAPQPGGEAPPGPEQAGT